MTLPNAKKSLSNSDLILTVDDNPDNLAVLSQTLKAAGYTVRVAVDGESALQQVEKELPALILLDVMMPGIDGFETCRRLKENPDTMGVPVIFMTALADNENKVNGLSLGAVDYITKPFYGDEVLARVRIHLKVQNLLHTLQGQNQQLKQEIGRRERLESQLQAFNDELETTVALRTAELQTALKNVQKAQVELVQKEKLSALGELMAGVAHEINNPVGCIANNIEFVEQYLQQLLDHADVACRSYSDRPDHPAASAITAHAKAIELPFIQEDLPSLVASMKTSSDRIHDISQSLRIFSRKDAHIKSAFDLHIGLNSTLLILKHRIKEQDNRAEIRIEKNYGTLSELFCYPGQINQVFMNILANAIDAFDEQSIAGPKIILRTEQTGEQVRICIEDNAGGMSEAVRSHIFDHTYTTKAAGKGTGLGLSIARQIIVDKHCGKISCESTRGKGTQFIIELPL